MDNCKYCCREKKQSVQIQIDDKVFFDIYNKTKIY
jgi:hypothetical protein